MRSRTARALRRAIQRQSVRPLQPRALIGELSDKPEGEDCLVLNVWTRGLQDGGKRPVMFWIHGGGFQSGSGSSPGYDGTNLCKRGDVVVVTINHRLNVMGFAFLGRHGGEEFANTGNVGMLDIVQALQLGARQHRALRRRSERVMIFGESGGGRKVGTLLAMPDAKGLFHRAVIQSGPTIRWSHARMRRSPFRLCSTSCRFRSRTSASCSRCRSTS